MSDRIVDSAAAIQAPRPAAQKATGLVRQKRIAAAAKQAQAQTHNKARSALLEGFENGSLGVAATAMVTQAMSALASTMTMHMTPKQLLRRAVSALGDNLVVSMVESQQVERNQLTQLRQKLVELPGDRQTNRAWFALLPAKIQQEFWDGLLQIVLAWGESIREDAKLAAEAAIKQQHKQVGQKRIDERRQQARQGAERTALAHLNDAKTILKSLESAVGAQDGALAAKAATALAVLSTVKYDTVDAQRAFRFVPDMVVNEFVPRPIEPIAGSGGTQIR